MKQQKKEKKKQNIKYKILLLWSQGPALYIEIDEYIQSRYCDMSSPCK